jgi:hypothetical protein
MYNLLQSNSFWSRDFFKWLKCKLFFGVLLPMFLCSPVDGWSVLTFNAGTSPFNIGAADFNGNGFDDLAVTDVDFGVGSQLRIFQNSGNGSFTQTQLFTINGANSLAFLAIGDFNGDDFPDIAVVPNSPKILSIFLNNGSGNFSLTQTLANTGNATCIALGNFFGQPENTDPEFDIVVGNANATLSFFANDQNLTGHFTPQQSFAISSPPTGIAVGELQGVNVNQIVVSYGLQDEIQIFQFNNMTSTLSSLGIFSVGSFPTQIAIGDLNNNGLLDLVVTNTMSNNVSVLLNQGNGTFQPAVNYAVGNAPAGVVLQDLNGDGFLDIAVANQAQSTVSILINNQNGTFQNGVAQPSGSGPVSITAGHFVTPNDLAVANSTGGVITIFTPTIALAKAVSVPTPSSILPPLRQHQFQKLYQFANQITEINKMYEKIWSKALVPAKDRTFQEIQSTKLAINLENAK